MGGVSSDANQTGRTMPSKYLPVDDIQAGMIVAKAVSDRDGRVIIPEGGRLTPMAINRLPRWGIIGVEVVVEDAAGQAGEADPAAPAAPARKSVEEDLEFAARVTADVELRFANLERTAFNDEYRQIVIRNLIEKGRGVVPGL